MGGGEREYLGVGRGKKGVELEAILVVPILIVWCKYVPFDNWIIGSVSNIYDTSYIFIYLFIFYILYLMR